MNCKRNILNLALAAFIIFGGQHVNAANQETIVIPNGFDTLEGNSWQDTNMTDTSPTGFRQQFIVSHLQFKSLNGPIWITGVQNRPDDRVTAPRSFTYSDVEIRISTTAKTPKTISTRFANNIGTDETLVYTGDVVLSTEGGKGLKDFDYVLDFQSPFYYDPDKGNLLFEFTCRGDYGGSPTNSPVMDGQWVEDRTLFSYLTSTNPNSTIGTITGDWFFIFRFTYEPARSPELLGDINGDKKVDCKDICFIVENWQKNEPFCDIAPEPSGDDIVNEQDIALLMEYIDINSLLIDSESNETEMIADGNCIEVTEDATLTIPNGFEYLEGNSWQIDNVGDLYPSGAREQELFSNEFFASISGPILITGAYYRPDAQVTAPRQFTYHDIEIRLSTTDKTPSTMSNQFSENIGSDETLVFTGDYPISTLGRDSLEDFDYEFKYQTPFYYDPSKGNLLADYTIRGVSSGTPTNSPIFDGQWISDRTQYCDLNSDKPDSERGKISGDWTCVLQLSYHPMRCPDLKGDLNGDGNVNSQDICVLIKKWQTDDSICDISPQFTGDGVVDIQDLIQLAKYINMVPPVAHWKFDETEGTIAHDSVGTNEAVVLGDAVWQPTNGNIGGALEFDGTDDYVNTPFIIDPARGYFSTFAWIKGGGPGQVIISQVGDLGEIWLGIDSLEGKLITGFCDIYFDPLESDAVITDGQWHHVGLVYDLDVFHRQLYVDGTLVAEDTTGVAGVSSDDSLYIGASKDLDASSFFSGLIDDVRIYEKALTPDEIAALIY